MSEYRRIIIFLITGGFAALINFSSRFIYSEFYSFQVAVVLSYITGMLVALPLFKKFVFKDSGNKIRYESAMFVLVNIVAIFLTWMVSRWLADYFFPSVGYDTYKYEVAHFIGILIPAISSYFGHKYLTFKKI